MKDSINFYFKRLLRQGSSFKNFSKELHKSQYFSDNELYVMKNSQLQKIIKHCYYNVPYYTDLFRELKLTPEDIQIQDDLVKLPYLDKYTVKENFDKLIAKNKSRILCNEAHTSGSRGTPGKFLRDYHSINFENAVLWRLWQSAGDSGLKRVTLRGDIIVPVSQAKLPFWKYNPANKELLMSSYHLSDKNAEHYIKRIEEFQPEILYAYPSTAHLLANFYRKTNQNYYFKAVFTSSESLSPVQRKFIENTFNCNIFDWYGQAERVVGLGQCEKGTYHIIEDYSIVELLETESGFEPVGTHLHNFIMPLLRYKTGDIIIPDDKKCSCGREFRSIKRIQGRNVDYIITPEGSMVTICNHIPRGVNNIVETQFVQNTIGKVIINIVATTKFSEVDKALLIKNTLEHTSPNMEVIINKVNKIPRGANGKFISVINNLAKEDQNKEVLI